MDDRERVALKFIAWMDTEEGKRYAAEADERSKKLHEELKRAGEIPWQKLYEPFTI